MGITLTGKKIKDTYEGLLKLSDNNPITVSYKKVTDGFGNETALGLSTEGVTCDKIYSTQTNSQIDAELDTIVPNKKWILDNSGASTSFVSLTDTFGSMSSRAHGMLRVNAAGTAIETVRSHYDFACGDETSPVAVGNVSNIRFPYAMESFLFSVFTVTTAPTGAPIVIDMLLNGVSVYGTNKPTIDIGSTTTMNGSVSYFHTNGTFDINQDDLLSVNVTQVGSSSAGTALKAFLTYNGNHVV